MKWWELQIGCAVLWCLPACAPQADVEVVDIPETRPIEAPAEQLPPTSSVRAPGADVGAPEAGEPVTVIPRAQWDNTPPDLSNLDYMSGVWKITIHHEGYTTYADEGRDAAVDRLKSIFKAHRYHRGYADIGYHFAIDPHGRVWECRSMKYQGAHVKDRNEHNAGIVLLGNFDEQQPTEAQVASLKAMVRQLMKEYRISPKDVRTHGERMTTACPGRNLQALVEKFRAEKWR